MRRSSKLENPSKQIIGSTRIIIFYFFATVLIIIYTGRLMKRVQQRNLKVKVFIVCKIIM